MRNEHDLKSSEPSSTHSLEAGRRAYRNFEPRPSMPGDRDFADPKHLPFYGWMIERAADVGKIQDECRVLEQYGEHAYDRAVSAKIAVLDMKHGL
jgi:hypothetical protein